jgi:hypothetical protein
MFYICAIHIKTNKIIEMSIQFHEKLTHFRKRQYENCINRLRQNG